MIEYKVLVVDDHKEIESSFQLYSMELEDRGLNVKFDIVSTIGYFEEKKDEQFDILMVDYNLRNGFFEDETMSMGTDFINDFRKNNMINKMEEVLSFPEDLEIEDGLESILECEEPKEDESIDESDKEWSTFLEEVDKNDTINNKKYQLKLMDE